MHRREFLKTMGCSGSAGLAVRAESPPQRKEPRETDRLKVGSLDLSELEIIDTHVHPPSPMTLSASYTAWNSSFVDALLPPYEFEGKGALRDKLSKDFERHLYNLPRQIGYNNYVARVHGVEPTPEGFDMAISRNLRGDFHAYVRSVLDRERIATVVLQSRDAEPRVPESHVPRDRFVWSYAITDMVHREWVQAKGAREIDDVIHHIDQVMETCASNQCAGFKSAVAYFRPLALGKVDKSQANSALRAILSQEPSGYLSFPGRIPFYDDPKLEKAQRDYQDFVLRHIFVKAGELGLPMIIHIAVALHPALQFRYNNPVDLYEVFRDPEIERAETRFVLIHTSYPYHHFLAAMLSQFPNVYTDLSFFSKFPGTLEETLSAFLSLAPSEKVMHGSDSNNVPEEIGYCADNTRRALARVLNRLHEHYAWTERDCRKIATNVLSENARRVFRIKA